MKPTVNAASKAEYTTYTDALQRLQSKWSARQLDLRDFLTTIANYTKDVKKDLGHYVPSELNLTTESRKSLLNVSNSPRGLHDLLNASMSLKHELKAAQRQVEEMKELIRSRPCSKSWIWRAINDDDRPERLANNIAEHDRLARTFAKLRTPAVRAAQDLVQSFLTDRDAVEKVKPSRYVVEHWRREAAQAKAAETERARREALYAKEEEAERARHEAERARLEALHAKTAVERAKAAELDKRTRKHARANAYKVIKTEKCPYCGGPLGDEPHLEHIYPVAKGGLSIVQNMVYACASCNSKKSDKGLIEFLDQAGFNVLVVLGTLQLMGKIV